MVGMVMPRLSGLRHECECEKNFVHNFVGMVMPRLSGLRHIFRQQEQPGVPLEW